MEQNIKELEINGVLYIPKDSISEKAESLDGMDYCIVRTHSAGVFAGYVEKWVGKEATIRKSRRIWYWKGAASLSQLGTDGTSCPDECKFPCEVDRTVLTEVIEIIYCTEKARKSIQGVTIWEK